MDSGSGSVLVLFTICVDKKGEVRYKKQGYEHLSVEDNISAS